jgi:3-hydroxyacyl-[acyl-carrier-protein] dehydratase
MEAEKTITGDQFFLTGHFPGTPIFPSAMMQEMSTQTAGVLIAAKYNPMPQYDTNVLIAMSSH